MKDRHLRPLLLLTLTASGLLLSGCIHEHLTPCDDLYTVRPIFERNMLFADAFASQVRSVDIKVFDSQSGAEVYAYSESGDALAEPGYTVRLPIPAGTYDILCWAGMAEGDSFSHTSAAEEDGMPPHGVRLNTAEGSISRERLNHLYHGLVRVTYTDSYITDLPGIQTADLPLTKNTNRIYVMLHNLDGTPLQPDDFAVSITADNGLMRHDNTLVSGNRVSYRPWDVSAIGSDAGEADAGADMEADMEADAGAVTGGAKGEATGETRGAAALLGAELSVGRLTAEGEGRLEVHRLTDGERIISIPLERNLLLYKGKYHAYMTDQEYLDRQDDYVITFILDRNGNWDRSQMIYINNWGTPPIQYQEW